MTVWGGWVGLWRRCVRDLERERWGKGGGGEENTRMKRFNSYLSLSLSLQIWETEWNGNSLMPCWCWGVYRICIWYDINKQFYFQVTMIHLIRIYYTLQTNKQTRVRKSIKAGRPTTRPSIYVCASSPFCHPTNYQGQIQDYNPKVEMQIRYSRIKYLTI